MKKVYSIFIFTIIIAFTWSALAGEPRFYGEAEYAQIVTVAKSGKKYNSIQNAINSITDATNSKRYCIKVMPGDYLENIIMKDYVDIIGNGRTNTRITPTSGTAVTFPANKATMQMIGIYVDYGTLGANSAAVISAGSDSVMLDCNITVTKSAGDFTMRALQITAGSFRLYQSRIVYSITGTTTDTSLLQTSVYQSGTSDILLFNNEITVTSDDTNDDLIAHETVAAGTGDFVINDNIITVTQSGANSATGLWLYGTASSATVARNKFTVTSQASISYATTGLWIDSASGGAVVYTENNNMQIVSSGTAYSCLVALGDTWNSSFDGIIAADGYSAVGTVNFASSPSAGNFLVSGLSFTLPESITSASEGVAASIAVVTTLVTTDGDSDLNEVTLADGAIGQTKKIVCVAEGNVADTWKITPTNMVGGAQITFTGAGEGCILEWTAGGWIVSGNNGGTIS